MERTGLLFGGLGMALTLIRHTRPAVKPGKCSPIWLWPTRSRKKPRLFWPGWNRRRLWCQVPWTAVASWPNESVPPFTFSRPTTIACRKWTSVHGKDRTGTTSRERSLTRGPPTSFAPGHMVGRVFMLLWHASMKSWPNCARTEFPAWWLPMQAKASTVATGSEFSAFQTAVEFGGVRRI